MFVFISDEPPPKGWPTSGEISFQNVYLRYGPDEPYVLKNINFKIQHKDKVILHNFFLQFNNTDDTGNGHFPFT